MGKEAVKYNANNPGETVIAAMNMDPWFLSSEHNDYDGDGKSDNGTETEVKHVGIQRSLLIVDGELWSTQQTFDESKLATPGGSTQFVNAQVSFAYTSTGKAFIGNPSLRITVKNDTQNNQVPVNGINRLPAANSILIYNQRCGTESYAHSDAYEIYLECDSEARIKIDSTITGKVVRSHQKQQYFDVHLGNGFLAKMPFNESTIYPVYKDKEHNFLSPELYHLIGKTVQVKITKFKKLYNIEVSRKENMEELIINIKDD